jgi:lipoate-protein ligase A
MPKESLNVVRPTPPAKDIAGLLQGTPTETLLLLDSPHGAYLGENCAHDYVNWTYCADNGIPVVRATGSYGAYYYRNGDAIWAFLFTTQRVQMLQVLTAFCAALNKLHPEGAFRVVANDVCTRKGHCACAFTETQRADGIWYVGLEAVLHTDQSGVMQTLLFPQNELAGGVPVKDFQEWVSPLDAIFPGDVASTMRETVIAVMEDLYGKLGS